MNRTLFLATVLGLLGSGGCQTARYVQKTQSEGIIAIPSDSNVWPNYNRRQAQELMSQHFPAGYEIIDEGEVVTGVVTHHDQRTDRHDFDHDDENKDPHDPHWSAETTRQTTHTHQTKEYQIHYRQR